MVESQGTYIRGKNGCKTNIKDKLVCLLLYKFLRKLDTTIVDYMTFLYEFNEDNFLFGLFVREGLIHKSKKQKGEEMFFLNNNNNNSTNNESLLKYD